MTELWTIMTLPLAACLVLTGMHVYFGLHVVRRGIIFVDLALAQTAAFSGTLAFAFGYGLHSSQSYYISLAATLIAAFVLANIPRAGVLSAEAYIGVLYAVMSAATVIALSFAAQGGEELRSLLVGHLLFVNWPELCKITAIYIAIGAGLWLVRKPIYAISFQTTNSPPKNEKFWDFLLYAAFGIVVTSSVEVAGVLVVFTFLVVPAMVGALLSSHPQNQLMIGWGLGFAVSAGGCSLSYLWDLPTGAAIVCLFGSVLLLIVLGRPLLVNKT